MDLNLKGKCALVTAASQGLGRACAEALAAEGARVAICSRSSERITRAASEIAAITASEVKGFVCDLTNSSHIQQLVLETRKHFGQVDILVFNHGNLPPGSFYTVSDEQWQRSLEACLWSAIHLCRALTFEMEKQMWGRIIFISSMFAMEPDPTFVVSSTLRGGLLGLAKCLARELAAYRITVNTVLPGYFDTPLLRQLASEQGRRLGKEAEQVLKDWTDILPSRILPKPLVLGQLVSWLSSEKASNITGTTITSDGGLRKGVL